MMQHRFILLAVFLFITLFIQAQDETPAILEPVSSEPLITGSKAKPIIESKNIKPDTTLKSIIVYPAVANPVTTAQEAAAEAAQRVIQAAAAKTGGPKIYGHSLFTDKSLEVFRTSDGAKAPETYILGAGDEIRITIFGASQTDMQLKIYSAGRDVEDLSAGFVAGAGTRAAEQPTVHFFYLPFRPGIRDHCNGADRSRECIR